MITQDKRGLLSKLNDHLNGCFQDAVRFAGVRAHYEATVEHLLLKLLEQGTGDLPAILRHFGADVGRFERELLQAVGQLRTGNSGRPKFSPHLLDALERAYLISSLELESERIRSGGLLAAIMSDKASPFYFEELEPVLLAELRRNFQAIVAGSDEDKPATGRFRERAAAAEGAPSGEPTALDQFTIDFTAAAAAGEIDPVLGRDEEIRQMIDILTRRRKNNPIIVGEAGVGKTALVEGLALRVLQGEVPQVLAGVEIRSLDLGLLLAGAGVKGEFENRLKSVIADIKDSPTPIVTFIDEAHTLIGAGASAGQGDAANLLKPALARGELRTIAATTWSEYKKYFEKDAALARRFQLVKVDEPDEHRALVMMRGIKSKFEDAHRVRILDSATVAAVQLADRYISGRQLPDKSVDLLDTAAARVRIGLTSKPAAIEDLEREIENATLARDAIERDIESGSAADEGGIAELEQQISRARSNLETLSARWRSEQEVVERILAARGEDDLLTAGDSEEDSANDEGSSAVDASDEDDATTSPPPAERPDSEVLAAALAELAEIQGTEALIPLEVTPDVIASVVSDWTGIPAGRMLRDQARSVLELDRRLSERVLGQDHALKGIAERVRAARAGLGNPAAPQGVFLLVGPSGIGKTETGLALANLLFGGERFMTTINMSEYMEAHTVSRLIGSPPGYVGFGEGGILTEAVRQRPYSVVLLDEVEKSHPDVMNLFYQVFDKGTLADGEGREIDFNNTVLVMTSNLASENIVEMCADDDEVEAEELVEAIRPVLRERFKPALLARMTIIPYFPLGPEVLRKIVDLKLGAIVRRLATNARIELSYNESVADWISERCTVEETGARNIDAIIQNEVLPGVSTEILVRMAEDEPIRAIRLDLGPDDSLIHEFS